MTRRRVPEVSTGISPPRAKLVVAFGAVYVLWGSTYLAIRFGVETIPPFLMAGTRHLTAGLILFLWTRLTCEPRPDRRHWGTAFFIGGLMLLGGNGLVTWAERRVPSGLAALIVASVPLWMALLDGIHRRTRPRLPVAAGLLFGLAGLLMLVAPGHFAGNGRVDLLGAGALLLAALCWTAGSLYSRHARLPESVLTATAMQMIGGGILLWLAGLAVGEGSRLDLAAVSPRSILSLGYLVVFGSLLGFSAYVWLLRATTPARVSTYAYVNPVVAVFLGWAFAGEAVTLRVALATIAIVASVALIIRYGGARARQEARKEVAA
jgi:drug/metabolite transporter (DMT)-like permease